MKNYLPPLLIFLAFLSCHKNPHDPSPGQGNSLAITSITPTHALAGTNITIVGTGFSSTGTDDVVKINGVVATVVGASPNQLQVTVPDNAGTGTVTVSVKNQTATGPQFTYDDPAVTVAAITPTHAVGGANITITGTGFSTTPSDDVIKINGVTATVVSATTSSLVVTVPSKSGSGAVTVAIKNQTTTGPQFTYDYVAVVSTLAGNTTAGTTDGTGTAAQFNYPYGVCLDSQGTLFIADSYNNSIRKSTPSGVVTTFAGASSGFNLPYGICYVQGNFYLADENNHRIMKITSAGVVSVFAGGGTVGSADGTGITAFFNTPKGICSDSQGNLYIADTYNNLIRKITPNGVVTTLAGSSRGNSDGSGVAAQFDSPYGICSDSQGNLYVTDINNYRIRKITPGGVVTTLAGSTQGNKDDIGAAAQFNAPFGICVDTQGNLYVSDYRNNNIRKITSNGTVTTIAGGTQGSKDDIGTSAQFNGPAGICIDSQGNLYVGDARNMEIRKIVIQ